MTILFLTNQLAVGGIETNLVRLVRALTARGHDVLVGAAPGVLTQAVEAAGGRVIGLPLDRVGGRATAHALRAVLATERPDVVHAFSATTAVILRRALRGVPARRRPFVVTSLMGMKDDPDESWARSVLRAWVTTWGADLVLVIAPSFERLLRRLPVSRRRLKPATVIGLDPPNPGLPSPGEVSRLRAELGLASGDRLVVTVGALEPRKSHELFIRAAAELARHRGDVCFVIVGGGSLEAALRDEAARAGIADRLQLVGERTDALRFIAAADVYVRPAVVEGFAGITVLEAQALGVPVVSFETMDVRLAVDPGVTGLLVPRGDTAALARTVGEILESPDMAERLGTAGRASVFARFAVDAVVAELEAIYETGSRAALGGKGRP